MDIGAAKFRRVPGVESTVGPAHPPSPSAPDTAGCAPFTVVWSPAAASPRRELLRRTRARSSASTGASTTSLRTTCGWMAPGGATRTRCGRGAACARRWSLARTSASRGASGPTWANRASCCATWWSTRVTRRRRTCCSTTSTLASPCWRRARSSSRRRATSLRATPSPRRGWTTTRAMRRPSRATRSRSFTTRWRRTPRVRHRHPRQPRF